MEKNRRIGSNSCYRITVRTLLHYSLIVLVGFALWSGRHLSVHHSALAGSGFIQSRLISADDLLATSLESFSSSYISEVPAEQMEMIDETGANDDTNDLHWHKAIHDTSSDRIFTFGTADNLIAQLEQSDHDRPSADLLTLHHSWKNFLG